MKVFVVRFVYDLSKQNSREQPVGFVSLEPAAVTIFPDIVKEIGEFLEMAGTLDSVTKDQLENLESDLSFFVREALGKADPEDHLRQLMKRSTIYFSQLFEVEAPEFLQRILEAR